MLGIICVGFPFGEDVPFSTCQKNDVGDVVAVVNQAYKLTSIFFMVL